MAFVAAFGLVGAGRVTADTILYTASTDNSGGLNPISVPNANNPFIPPISPGVTLTPNPAFLDSNFVGPLNGILYGPFGFGGNEGGTTGFVHVSFTLPALPAGATGFRLVWEVSDVIDHTRPSALAIDNVRLGSTLLFGFDSGIPAGFTALGTVGTSGAIPDLSPTQGTAFAFLDTTGNVRPIYDTVDGTFGSRLFSSPFTATAGTILSLDMAFLTNDGGPFHDYGIVALQAIPEPASLKLLASGVVFLAGFAWRHRRRDGAPSRGARPDLGVCVTMAHDPPPGLRAPTTRARIRGRASASGVRACPPVARLSTIAPVVRRGRNSRSNPGSGLASRP